MIWSSVAQAATQLSPNSLDKVGSGLTINDILPLAVYWFLGIAALVAFLSLIYSGIMYITAGGDPGKAVQARKNILWAIIGIVIISASYLIVVLAANIGGLNRSSGGQSNTGGSSSSTPQNGASLPDVISSPVVPDSSDNSLDNIGSPNFTVTPTPTTEQTGPN